MRIESKNFAMLLASASGVVYAACSLFVALFPKGSETLMSALTHVKSPIFVRQITAGGFFLGLVQVIIYMFLLGLVFSWVFNRSFKNN